MSTSYRSDEISERDYARPLVPALGTYFASLADDKQYYEGLCRSLVAGFVEPWRLIEASRRTAAPDQADVEFVWQRRLLKLNQADKVQWFDGTFRFPMPTDVTSARFIGSSASLREALFFRGIDFEIVQQGESFWLSFVKDPFLDDRFTVESELAADNTVSGTAIRLWLAEAGSGIRPLEQNWSLAFGMTARSETDRSFLSQLFLGLGSGPAAAFMQIGAGRAFGHPVCEIDGETVEDVTRDRRGVLVVTDQSAYRYPDEAEIIVSVGDTLRLGQPISSAVRWYDLARGAVPDLPGLAVGSRDLGVGYHGGLIFPNERKELLVTSQADRTKVSVELGGSEEDQTLFWDEVHTRGVAGGTTLANYLDVRPNPVGEPTAFNLPTELNPYEFFVSEVLRYHTTIVDLDYSQNLSCQGAVFLSRWKEALPAHQAIHSFSRMSVEDHTVDVIVELGEEPMMGLAMSVEGGYYALGTQTSAGGSPVIAQEA